MIGVVQGMFIALLSVEFLMGNLGNGFIALVNCMDWVQRRKISSVDHILTALAISRIGLLWSVLLSILISSLDLALGMTGNISRMVNLTWAVANHFSIWLATCLSIFYFLKIANFSHSIFLYLKWRVKKVISGTLVMSLILLFSNIVQLNSIIDLWIGGHKTNMSYSSSSNNTAQLSRLAYVTNTMFTFIPFTVSLTTCLLLICSLWKHLKKMQHNAAGSRDASTMAHIKALLTVISFLLLYTIFFLSLVLQVCSFESLEENIFTLFWPSAIILFPAGHSFVLILGNSKLRQASRSVLWWLKCRSKDVEPLSP